MTEFDQMKLENQQSTYGRIHRRRTMIAPNMPTLFHQTNGQWLAEARLTAETILAHNGNTPITTEDVLHKCDLPKYLSRNLIGNIFNRGKQSLFEPTGITSAKHTVANGRIIRTWRLKNETL